MAPVPGSIGWLDLILRDPAGAAFPLRQKGT